MTKKVGRENFEMDLDTLSRFQQTVDLLGERGQAAKTIGLSRDALQKAYYGHSSPKFEVVKRICEAAGMSLDWLATGKVHLSTSNDDPWKLPSSHAFVYEMNKSPKKSELAYFERKDGKALLGLIEEENEDDYEVLVVIPGEETKSQKLVIEKADLKGAYPAQIIKSLSG